MNRSKVTKILSLLTKFSSNGLEVADGFQTPFNLITKWFGLTVETVSQNV